MTAETASPLRLPSIYGDHMVLQHGRTAIIWGWATPGIEVTARLNGDAPVATRAGRGGRWRVTLPARLPGGPHILALRTGDGAEIVLRDILFGDVWICSGQSNMEWPFNQTHDAATERPRADHSGIRLFTVAKNAQAKPVPDCGGTWQCCTPETVGLFSGVGYHFGQELARHLDLHIGLINTSWGGTKAEAWTSAEALRATPGLAYLAAPAKARAATLAKAYRTIADYRPEKGLERRPDGTLPDPGRRPFTHGWEAPGHDDSRWLDLPVPGDWDNHGLAIDGAVWYRRQVVIPATWAGRPLTLSLGVVDDFDTAWFNGVEVGRTGMETPNWWQVRRKYAVPAHLVAAGEATVAVRVFDHFMNGGMMGPSDGLLLHPAGDEAEAISLAGFWRTAIELAVKQPPPASNCSLFNGMIAPLLPLAVKGAIWYQGESNADRAEEYRTLLATMIADWRRRWGVGDFPFYIVQLANYMATKDEPGDSAWAELRDAQRQVAETVPNGGMAAAIDLGEADDIHPRNKRDVGRRLAWQALRKTYRIKDIHCDGPRLDKAVLDGGTVLLAFAAEGGALSTRDGAAPQGFAVAGADRVFHWADAEIVGPDRVVLCCPAVPQPRHVRYAWADNPVANLVDAKGLPATPFSITVG